jgi:hypothetical protein
LREVDSETGKGRDMHRRNVTRRSFLERVGGIAVAGGALAIFAEGAGAHPTSDNDPTDGVGAGRSRGTWPHSDTDQGPYADGVGRAGRLGHFSDSDSGAGSDPVNHGRRFTDRDPAADAPARRIELTDRDRAPYSDAPGRGRRPPRR